MTTKRRTSAAKSSCRLSVVGCGVSDKAFNGIFDKTIARLIMIKYSFSPISHPNARVLILGTMPGAQSLALQQYYGHPRNAFWKIIFNVLEAPFSTDYEERKSILVKNRIALWDVLEACVREGSLDSAIEQEVANDFDSFLKAHPHITHIYFNGQKAAKFFKQYVAVTGNYQLITLPSTSPANAGMSFEKKLLEWESIKL